jgi:hypothetical protein
MCGVILFHIFLFHCQQTDSEQQRQKENKYFLHGPQVIGSNTNIRRVLALIATMNKLFKMIQDRRKERKGWVAFMYLQAVWQFSE